MANEPNAYRFKQSYFYWQNQANFSSVGTVTLLAKWAKLGVIFFFCKPYTQLLLTRSI